MNISIRHGVAWSVLVLLGADLVGCEMKSGPPTYKLSGAITFDGQPIPKGMIVFTPDSSKGNSGPQGVAMITDGKYDTSTANGSGVGSGPTIVRVMGEGGAESKLICEYEYSVDLPPQDSELPISVPATAANRKPPSPEI
ncbi:hypothetical protein ETAA8_63580 [Anatilimnocola aggregata]|uniref:Carboxypeptidase regulatory-like domain-containing protein n=1 Tax=Anatilimnocola aggregata TaxID=2528021 RepID=A0A517YLV2_9BACT|nr:hypothetical protein [Anatilimnocola aggregata]QDU31205.1 hypothetical protein ETAA8_63580 [Anatilimnocola aggregata]